MSNTPKPSAGGFLVRYRRLIREGGFLLAGQGSAAIAGLIGIRLVTELAPRPVFGEANLLLGILLLGRNLFVGPISNAQLLFHARYLHAGRPGWFIKRIARTTWLATLAMVAVGLLAYLGWAVYRGQSFRLHLVGILILVALIETFKSIRLNALSAERRQARVAAWMGIEAWVWLATACAALLDAPATQPVTPATQPVVTGN